jgi:hypothetical protein
MSALPLPLFRVWVRPLLAVLAGWALLTVPIGAQPPERAAAPDKAQLRVFPLRDATAAEAARLIREALTPPGGRLTRFTIATDERTNSLIVSGLRADLDRVEALLGKIDVEAPAKERAAFKLMLIPLRPHSFEKESLEAALRIIFDGRQSDRYALDRNLGWVILYGDPQRLDNAVQLVRLLSEAGSRRQPESAGNDLELHVYWVVSAPTREGTPKTLEDFREATADLARLGIDRPRLAGQVVVTATPGGRFEVAGLGGADGASQLAVTGSVADRTGAAGLEVTISVMRAPGGKDAAPICRLRTQATVPLDRPTVLGTAPAEVFRSAFVVLVQHKKPAGSPGKGGERKLGSFGFRTKPWAQVLEWLGDQTGLPVISDTRPMGTFTFIPPRGARSYSTRELVDILNEALLKQNLLLLRRANSFILVPSDKKLDPMPARGPIRPENLEEYPSAQVVSLLVRLRSATAEKVAADVKKLLGPSGEVAVLKESQRAGLAGHGREPAEGLQAAPGG